MIVRAKFNAWKNMWYPLGLPVQWGPRIRPYTYSDNREAKSSARIPQEHWKKLALRSRESRCLETTEAARAQDWESSSGCASLVSLRLPLIGQRVRRVLYVWRKRAKTKARVRLIRNTPEGSEFRAVGEPFSDLNIGMNVRCWTCMTERPSPYIYPASQIAQSRESNKGLARPQERFSDADAAQQVQVVRRRHGDQGYRGTKEPDFKCLGRRVELPMKDRSEHKGYLHLHMLNTSDKKTLPIC